MTVRAEWAQRANLGGTAEAFRLLSHGNMGQEFFIAPLWLPLGGKLSAQPTDEGAKQGGISMQYLDFRWRFSE